MTTPPPVCTLLRCVREPRVERSLMFLIYALAFGMGASVALGPPASIEGTIGTALTYLWAALLVLCGAFGMGGVFPGVWWAERVAVQAGATGAAIYAAIVLYIHWDTSPGNRLPQFFAIAIVTLVFVGRGYKIRGVNYEPRPDKE